MFNVKELITSPVIFGTFKISLEAMKDATEHFRVFETAIGYGNLINIGEAIKMSDRKQTIMLKFDERDFKEFDRNCDIAVKRLGKIPEIVVLQHHVTDNIRHIKMLKDKFKEALVGVSNVDIEKVRDLILNNCKPDFICVEYSPYCQPDSMIRFCHGNGIIVTVYGCLCKGELCENDVILTIAEKYLTSPASIILKWVLAKGIYPIIRTNDLNHMHIDYACDLKLDDIRLIDMLNNDK